MFRMKSLIQKTGKIWGIINLISILSGGFATDTYNTTMDKIRERKSLELGLVKLNEGLIKYRENAVECLLERKGYEVVLEGIRKNKKYSDKNKIHLFEHLKPHDPESCRTAKELQDKIDVYFRLRPDVGNMESYTGVISVLDSWEIIKGQYKNYLR